MHKTYIVNSHKENNKYARLHVHISCKELKQMVKRKCRETAEEFVIMLSFPEALIYL